VQLRLDAGRPQAAGVVDGLVPEDLSGTDVDERRW
jgi:hypothetical protein